MFSELWFRGLEEKEKKELEASLLSSPVSKRLKEILDQFEREIEIPSRKDYDNPNWAYKQAHFNGEVLVLRKIKDLLTPTTKG